MNRSLFKKVWLGRNYQKRRHGYLQTKAAIKGVNFVFSCWNSPAFDILIFLDFQDLANMADSSAETTLERKPKR